MAALVLTMAGSGTPKDALSKVSQERSCSGSDWTCLAGFVPSSTDARTVCGVQKGNPIVTKDILRAHPDCPLPRGLKTLMEHYGLAVRLGQYRAIAPSRGYVHQTRKRTSVARAVETGESIRRKGITGYRGGLPFPGPKTGLEVVWNAYYAYRGDDNVTTFDVYWLRPGKGVVRRETWRWLWIRAKYRSDLVAHPDVSRLASDGVFTASLLEGIWPDDKAHVRAVIYRYDGPRDPEGYLYLPGSMHTLRLPFAIPGVPWNETDFFYEDIRGYSSYPEWMHFELLGKTTILAPMHSLPLRKDCEPENDCVLPDVVFEPRPVYVVQGRPKLWTSPYSRVVLYVDAETYYIPVKEAYDEDGRLWKLILHGFDAARPGAPPSLVFGLAADLSHERATLVLVRQFKANVGLEGQRFTHTRLLMDGR